MDVDDVFQSIKEVISSSSRNDYVAELHLQIIKYVGLEVQWHGNVRLERKNMIVNL